MDNDDKRHNHGLIVWDGVQVGQSHSPGIKLDDYVIGEAFVVVYDVTNQSSFPEAGSLLQSLNTQPGTRGPYFLESLPGSLHVLGPRVVVLVGSKADLLMDRKIIYEVLSYYDFIHV